MKHPNSRAERRHNGEVWRNRNRKVLLNWWERRSIEDASKNRMWWARKQFVGHGNRCMCHCEKVLERRKRRVALDRTIIENLISFDACVAQR